LHEAVIEKQSESAKILKTIMTAMRAEPETTINVDKRKALINKLLDAPSAAVNAAEETELSEDVAPPPAASSKKPRSKFSSARAGSGMRAKTSIEIAKEEAASGSSGVQGKAPAVKTKSRILQPGSSSAFGF